LSLSGARGGGLLGGCGLGGGRRAGQGACRDDHPRNRDPSRDEHVAVGRVHERVVRDGRQLVSERLREPMDDLRRRAEASRTRS
jgi:hypothetical protein